MNEMSKPIIGVSPSTLARFIKVIGEKNAITEPNKQAPYLVEFRALWTGRSPVILRPGWNRVLIEVAGTAGWRVRLRAADPTGGLRWSRRPADG